MSCIKTGRRKMGEADYFLAVKPLTKMGECGDTGLIKEFDNKIFIGLVDAAGHSKDSYKIAMKSREFLLQNYQKGLIELVNGLHEHIKVSNGAVAELCLLNLDNGHLKYVGIGDVKARIFGTVLHRIIAQPGIIGFTMPTPREENVVLNPGDALVMYTDGVKDHFDLEDYPDILSKEAEIAANHIVFRFGRKTDDAACIVLKYYNSQY
jgi:negative regulator of sigma-B (phosphoserine phosphatase)